MSPAASCDFRPEAAASLARQLTPPLSAPLMEELDRYSLRAEQWGGRFVVRGGNPGPDAIRLDGNDYLQLVGREEVIHAQIAALQAALDGKSQVIQSGAFATELHPMRQLEQDLAAFLGKETGHLVQSGYAANLALLQAICRPEQPVYVDALAHMSLWEGVRSSGATAVLFRHNNVEHLEGLIARKGPGVVVVDTVYSGTGSMCPLRELVELCERQNCTLVVDESHSIGLYGPQGAGLLAAEGLTDRVHFITVSLAKAFASRAGFFTIPAAMRDFVFSSAYPTVFSTSLLAHEIAGLAATLELIKKADAARARLHAAARRVRKGLLEAGFPVNNGTEQIFCLEAGPEPASMALRDAFEARNIFGALFCAPATASERSMLRFTLHSELSEQDIEHIVMAAREVAQLLRPWEWASARRQRLTTPPSERQPG